MSSVGLYFSLKSILRQEIPTNSALEYLGGFSATSGDVTLPQMARVVSSVAGAAGMGGLFEFQPSGDCATSVFTPAFGGHPAQAAVDYDLGSY